MEPKNNRIILYVDDTNTISRLNKLEIFITTVAVWFEDNFMRLNRSVLQPLLFNIYINDLLLFVPYIDICDYADDTALYLSGTDTINIMSKLESSILTVVGRFEDNCMRLNREKCYFMGFGDQSNDLTRETETIPIAESRKHQLLRIRSNRKLAFLIIM